MEQFPRKKESLKYNSEDLAILLSIEPATWAELEQKFPGTGNAVEAVREGKMEISTLPELLREDVKRLMLAHASPK